MSFGEEKCPCQGLFVQLDVDGRNGLGDGQHRVNAHVHFVLFQQPVEFPIDLQRDETDADVRLDPVVVEVEYRADLQLRLRNSE